MAKGIHILIVDDDREIADAVKSELEIAHAEWQVSICYDGEDALKMMAKEKFSLVISDYNMPFLTGVVFLKAVREFDKNVPFIFMTGNSTDSLVERIRAEGAVACLDKGTQIGQLVSTVESVLKLG